MYAYIKGSLEEKTNTFIVVENNGIGYKIFMSESAIQKLGERGENIKIHTYYYVKEDNISLYGFLTNEELKMFELLLTVSGIGAKSAIVILSNITPSSFALAVITDDDDVIPYNSSWILDKDNAEHDIEYGMVSDGEGGCQRAEKVRKTGNRGRGRRFLAETLDIG